jgi:putative transcriptional regulator
MASNYRTPPSSAFPSLVNHFLIAMPNMLDPNFSGTLIFVCEHNEKGALGLVVNRDSEVMVSNLFEKLDLNLEISMIGERKVLSGGPVQSDRGFVLHRPAQEWGSTLKLDNDMALTTSKDVLEALAKGAGPAEWLVTLGYAGWSAGQLDEEIAQNAWLTVPARSEILFQVSVAKRFDEAFKLLGFDPGCLSATAGHA